MRNKFPFSPINHRAAGFLAAAGLIGAAAVVVSGPVSARTLAADAMLGQAPMPVPADPRPAIHGTRIEGCTPGHPFMFLVPATGKAPLTYSAEGLPQGLTLNSVSGIITGQSPHAGSYKVKLFVSGPAGKTSRMLSIVSGDHKLALTPPMGWNAWDVFGDQVTDEKVRDQADWMVQSGLAAHGYQYIMLDDTWEARRDDQGNLFANRKMKDIKALADYIHAKGLKLGIYSSPSDNTCSGYTGSLGFEQKDAQAFASWGVDYLKYDWCRAGKAGRNVSTDEIRDLYARMRKALDNVNRDIVYAVTTYGIGNPWDWGIEVGANSWSTSSEMFDTYDLVLKDGLGAGDHSSIAEPGHWNDPGWLMLGRLNGITPHFTKLTKTEQMTQVSLWSLLAAPLVLSCDMSSLDPNTFYPLTTLLLTNDEVIDVDQDPLGKAATRVGGEKDIQVWARPLSDGTTAVGIFNTSTWKQTYQLNWSDINLSGPLPVRDLWRHKNLGPMETGFATEVPEHGVILLKVGKPTTSL